MIDKQTAIAAVIRLHALRYFPVDQSGAADEEIARLFKRMVSTPEQLRWLCDTLIDQVGFYPGTQQLRAVFCTRFKPMDGIEANVSPELPIYQSAEQCELADRVRQVGTPEENRKLLSSLGLDAESKALTIRPRS